MSASAARRPARRRPRTLPCRSRPRSRAVTQLSLQELAARIGAEVRGDGARRVSGVGPLESAGPEQLAFYANPRYRQQLSETRAAAVIVAEDEAQFVPPAAARLVAAQPYVAFAK